MIPLKLLLPPEYPDKTEIYARVEKHKRLEDGEYIFASMYSLDSPDDLFFGVFRRDDEKPLALLSFKARKKNAEAALEEALEEEQADALFEIFYQDLLPKYLVQLQGFISFIKKALKDPKDPIHQRIARRTAWIATRFSLPATVHDKGESFQPDAIAWVNGDNGEVLSFDAIHPSEGDNIFVRQLKKLLKENSPPAMIRVEKESQAKAIRSSLKKITVLVEEIPELKLVQEFLSQQFEEENKPVPTYLSGDAKPESIATFFQVAAKVFRTAPWKKWADYPMLQIDVPSLQIDGGAITLMGQGKSAYGFIFFNTGEDAYDFYSTATEEGEEDESPDVPFMLLEFCSASELDPTLRKEIASHTWEVASTKSFPVLKDISEDLIQQPITEKRVKAAIACCESILAFYAAHQKELATEAPFEAEGELKSKELGHIRFLWPHPEVLFEEESEEKNNVELPSAEDFGRMLRQAAQGNLGEELDDDDEVEGEFEVPEELGKVLFETLSNLMQPKIIEAAPKKAAKKTTPRAAATKPTKKTTAAANHKKTEAKPKAQTKKKAKK